jgi:hypothetical protein
LHTLRLGDNRTGLGSSTAWTALAATLRDVYGTSLHTAPRAATTTPSLHTLDLSGNGADEASVAALLQAVLDVAQQNHDDEVVLLPQCLIVGGNETGERVESLVRQIQQIRPTMDIARDKIKRTNAF